MKKDIPRSLVFGDDKRGLLRLARQNGLSTDSIKTDTRSHLSGMPSDRAGMGVKRWESPQLNLWCSHADDVKWEVTRVTAFPIGQVVLEVSYSAIVLDLHCSRDRP